MSFSTHPLTTTTDLTINSTPSRSTIFARHTKRNLHNQQKPERPRMMAKDNLDGSTGETLANMSSRSSIFQRNKQRQQVLGAIASNQESMAAVVSRNGTSLIEAMSSQSTIYQRNARRAARWSS